MMAKLGGASIEFLRVLRRVAYLLLPHRPSNIYTVFLEIKLLYSFKETVAGEYVFGL